jgi:O-antigen/teichoic acid export membrane protein
MSRFRRAAHGVASGYVSLAAAAVYSLATVPLALHYLNKQSFALWALMSTISGYLSLVDFGMSGSVARLLIDHKDDRAGGVYGSLIKTGWLVLWVQAGIILVAGFFAAPVLAGLLDLPAELKETFISLLRWQSGLLAFSFITKIFSHVLTAHQRMDMVNYGQIAGLALNYVLLWYFFNQGHGVFSWIWSTGLAFAGTFAWLFGWCAGLNLFPPRGRWGQARWIYFRELFGYGKDLFLIAVGTQLIIASQTMIITRTIGLEAAAMWSIGTKMFNLLSQVIWRIFDVSSSALTEMFVRNEATRLRERYGAIVILSASFSAFVAVTYALCNRSFVSVWTHGKIDWPTLNDVLLGAWMIVMAVLHCHNCFVLITKRVGFMRYIYFVEGIVFVAGALLMARIAGMPGIIGCSIVCSLLLSGAYGIFRVHRHFGLRLREVAWEWMLPMFRLTALYLPIALIAGWALRGFGPQAQLAVFSMLVAPLGFCLFLRFGLPAAFQRELLQRAPGRINPLLRHIFVVSPS